MAAKHNSISYLGPEGTYCNEAAEFFAERLGFDDAELLPCATFDEVFDAVDRGVANYGVVAKENSLEGPVTATLDNFAFRSQSVILAEHVIDIHHCLVMSPDSALDKIQKIASHHQGLAQCKRYLNEKFPGKETIATTSTAQGAKLALADPTVAGIANAYAAKLHGCEIAAENIEDHHGNQTSFALIGRPGSADILTRQEPSEAEYKTSLALWLQIDRAGALHMILSEFAYAGINLTMVQSRPLKQQLGDYMFFMEFKGRDSDINTQTALSCLRLKLREVKILGSYPVI